MATKEQLAERRKKELAILKAENELLEQAKKTIIEHGDADELVLEQIDTAQSENLAFARNTYGASPEEVESAQYHGASVAEIKKYQRRLAARGLTHEQLAQKELAVATVGKIDDDEPDFIPNRTEVGVGKVDDKATSVSLDDLVEEKPKKQRRTRKKKADVAEEKKEEVVDTGIKIAKNVDKTIVIEKQDPVVLPDEKRVETAASDSIDAFRLDEIPDYVQYDIIPLPSNGQCYKGKRESIPVAYLTAADENIIASPNMYRDGKLLDVILKRKILDKSINVDDLCSGDRDAIIMWLRATAYGQDFPIVATNPETGKQYSLVVNLSDFKYYPFELKSNDNALFEYKTEKGDLIEFKFLSAKDEEEYRRKIQDEVANSDRLSAIKNLNNMRESIALLNIGEEDLAHIAEDVEEILSIIGTDIPEQAEFTSRVTEQMIIHTVAVNGNRDREYIKNFIENMRSKDAIAYRNYFSENRPGVDFKLTVNIPESDGGGSFDTFLRLDDTIFINF